MLVFCPFFPGRLDMLHAFYARPRVSAPDTPPTEFGGYEILLKRYSCPPEKWKLSNCNKDYKVHWYFTCIHCISTFI